jgi:tetratricopeptide (TPR) repeat protein
MHIMPWEITKRAIFHWRRSTSSPEIHLRLAQVHTAAGDYTALVEDYLAVLSFNPNDPAVNYQLGLVYAAVQPDLALTYLQIAGALNKDYANDTRRLQQVIRTASLFDEPAYTLLESGRVLAGMQEWQLAAYAFYQAVVARPDYAEAWALLGEARQHLAEGDSALPTQIPSGELSLALENLEQAVQLDPQSILANALLGLYWQRLGDYDQAVKYLSISAGLDPRNPAFQVELGNCLAQKGDLNGALEFYQKAVDLDPQDSTYWRILGSFSLRHQVQLRDIGLPAARQASILSPSDPMSLDLMGQVLSSLGDFANAERFFLTAISEDPQFAPAYLHNGINHLIQGDNAQARQQIEYAFHLSPESPTGQQAVRILQRYFP